MSPKPGVGINYKLYGVTNEAVIMILEAASRSRGVDPPMLEAQTLFHEHRHKPGPSPPELSTCLPERYWKTLFHV